MKQLYSILLILAISFSSLSLIAEEPADTVVVEAPAPADAVPAAEETVPATPAVEEASEAVAELPMWVTVLGSILSAVVLFLSGFLKKKWGAETEKAQLDANKSLMEQKNFLIDNRLIPFAIATAEHWLMTQLMTLIKDAADGGEFHWKEHYSNLKSYMKDQILKKFLAENTDIIEQLGEKELDNLIDRLATKLITKLPDSVQKFIPDSASKMLSEKASDYIVEKGKDLLGLKEVKAEVKAE